MKISKLVLSICVAASSAYAQNTTEKQKPDTLKKDLMEVTVEANHIVTTPEKMMIFVDKNVKKHSYDGYAALSLLQIPGLSVDAIDGNVSALTGGVMLCINGIESTQKEIKTLNPKDIIRIDYYTNFDPRHPTARNVIDFIMKIRDYGGTVMLQATQSLNIATGADMADWKMYHKKAEFGVNVLYNFMHYKQDTENVSRRLMHFDDGYVDRVSQALPTKNNSNAYDITFSYIQRFKNSNLKAAFNVTPKHGVGNGEKSVTYTGLLNDKTVSVDNNHNDAITPSFNVMYDHMFKNQSMLMASVSGSYFKTDISRNYFGLEDILSTTTGHGSSISPSIMFNMPVGKICRPGIHLGHHYTHTNSRYTENGAITPNKYTFQETTIVLFNQMQFSNTLNAHIELQAHMLNENPGTGNKHEFKLTPYLDLSYMLPKDKGNINLTASMGTNSPEAGWVNPIIRQRDEFLATAGNPYLKTSTDYKVSLSYRRDRKWGYFSFFTQYSNRSKAIYRDYTCDDERDVFIETYMNGGNYEQFAFNTGVQYRIIPNKVNISAGATYQHYKTRAFGLQQLNRVYASMKANYMDKGFVADLEVGTPRRSINQAGIYVKDPYKVNLTLGYNIKNWSFNFMTRNPFMKTYRELILNLPDIHTSNRVHNPKLSYDYFAVRISYRFNYGKPHNFDSTRVSSKVKKYDLGE